MWNEIIRTFRTSMPVGRHRRGIKVYENCFYASDAVHWLQLHLRKNPNFGNDVSKHQIVQLLSKFHKSGVFQDVRGSKYNSEPFEDGSRLFKFSLVETTLSPLSAAQRRPLREHRSFRSPRPAPLSLSSEDCSSRRQQCASSSYSSPWRQESNCSQRPQPAASLSQPRLAEHEIGDIWLQLTLARLCELLELSSIKELVDPSLLYANHVLHNATCVSKSGLVTVVAKSEQLPCWVLNAMRCLSQWPNAAPSGLPSYEGFESDIFAAVAEYFTSDPEPLVPVQLYDMFVNVLVLADNLVGKQQCQQAPAPITTSCADMMQQISHKNVRNRSGRGCRSECEDMRLRARRLRASASDASDIAASESAGIHTIDSDSLLIACLQVASLLLPPARRRRLHLLLRFMKKVCDNDRLRLDPLLPTHDVVLQTFTPCVMRRQQQFQRHNGSSVDSSCSSCSTSYQQPLTQDLFAMQVTAFISTNYNSVMSVPFELKDKAQAKIAMRSSQQQQQQQRCTPRALAQVNSSSAAGASCSSSSSGTRQYCKQLPASQYSVAGRLTSEQALLELLEGILRDENLQPKEKRRRLRAFKECHPHVYAARFPDADVEKSVIDSLRDRSGVLARTLAVLRNWQLGK